MNFYPLNEGEIFEAPWIGYGILPTPGSSLVALDAADDMVRFIEGTVTGYNMSIFCIRFSLVAAHADGAPWVASRIASIQRHYFGSMHRLHNHDRSETRLIENISISQLYGCLKRMQPDSVWAWQC